MQVNEDEWWVPCGFITHVNNQEVSMERVGVVRRTLKKAATADAPPEYDWAVSASVVCCDLQLGGCFVYARSDVITCACVGGARPGA
jgi:hypothetical protein